VYPDQGTLISAMRMALIKLDGSGDALQVRKDEAGRIFGEIRGKGSESDWISFLKILAKDVGAILNLDAGNDMRDLYTDICHTNGEPMYFSDGVYLEADGELIER